MSADDAHEPLSALADGELGPDQVARLATAWRDDAEMRRTWHAYHLIGDVLRSDDLASRPGHDAAFVVALRSRLAQEPVVLAPQRATAVAEPVPVLRRRPRWRGPAAVAAGFVAVAGVLVVTRGPLQETAPAPMVAGGTPAAVINGGVRPVVETTSPGLVAAPAPVAAAPRLPEAESPAMADGKLIRDARLDRYLAAHQQFAGTSAIGMPSSFLRGATAEAGKR